MQTMITVEKRYEYLINARNFHYDNFSKWMTYFYVAVGTLFVGYCTIISSDKLDASQQNLLVYSIQVIGFITSLFWYWSCKGYYYWNINFISLVNYYEEKLLELPENERVYFVFANKNTENDYTNPIKGANISTSKVAILFSFFICSFWGMLFYNKILQSQFTIDMSICFFAYAGSIFSILFISTIIPERWLKSNIDFFPDLELKFENKNSKK